MVMLDANLILRYLLDDNEEMAEKAEQCINERDVAVTIEVLAEVLYVLKGVYKLERNLIVKIVIDFTELVSCSEKDVVDTALTTYGECNLDFVDCVLYAYNRIKGIKIATFDKKLQKMLID
ncbi:MAG: PIN domain-containing protein [Firmicutes bacterium]|nr:PIN domain-containing protein [Bacillota bacterium]